MLEEKAISKEEYEEAVNYKLVFTNSEGYVPKAGKTKRRQRTRTRRRNIRISTSIMSSRASARI